MRLRGNLIGIKLGDLWLKTHCSEIQVRQSSANFFILGLESSGSADAFKVHGITLLRTSILETTLTGGLSACSGMRSIMYCHSKMHNEQSQNSGRQPSKRLRGVSWRAGLVVKSA